MANKVTVTIPIPQSDNIHYLITIAMHNQQVLIDLTSQYSDGNSDSQELRVLEPALLA